MCKKTPEGAPVINYEGESLIVKSSMGLIRQKIADF
jgi:hypothetical protein